MADDVFADGVAAERLLADPTLAKVLGRLEEHYTAQWKVESLTAKREHLHACVKALGDIRGELEALKTNKAMKVMQERTITNKKR